ncbi:hypothetical protein [Bartonella sp. WD16.2]|uniref:hypothetical protein n=1 Tax=Bartonella sp. WD16.2 TaxID=1933904 RepID=UPI00099940BD|nr:hypothetical protein [Bartonella sp. WD16.2]AQX19625.1 hypothetical protein BWD162_005010 [Bartonella sp. WD16.2]
MVKTTKVSLKKLKLDPENPRISVPSNEKDAINSLCDTEQITELAKDIAENGISPCEKFIVLQDREKYIVLEGNRRLIALKFIDNPNLAPERFFKKISKYSANRKVRISSVECMIVSNRKEANHWIEIKHLGQNKGKGVKQWNAIQKARQSQSSPDRFACLLFDHLLEDPSQYYNISTVTRFISKPIFSEYTGIDYDQEKDKVIFPSYEENSALDNCLKQFVQDMLEGKINSRTHNSKKSIEKYFELLFRRFKLTKVYSRNDSRRSKDKKETKHSEEQYRLLFNNDANKNENCQKQKLSCYDEEIAKQLTKLGYIKLISIYSSVKKLNIHADTPLLYMAFNCLFEALTGILGRPKDVSFDTFLKNHSLLKTIFDNTNCIRDNKKDTLATLTKVRKQTNIAKHALFAAPLSYEQIVSDMQVLKPLLMLLINEACKNKPHENQENVSATAVQYKQNTMT